MPAPTMPLVLAATGLLLAGCASTHALTPNRGEASASATSSMQGMSMAPGQSMSGMTKVPAQSVPGTAVPPAVAVGTPTATALMICSNDIKAKVKQVLTLPGQPRTTSSFANQIYTCTYDLPVGPLLLSVQHSPTKTAANAYYSSIRTTMGPTDVLIGLGDKAYGAPTGIAVVLKDTETLVVDARGLPPVFGADQQKRTDLANEIASDVLGCWTGD